MTQRTKGAKGKEPEEPEDAEGAFEDGRGGRWNRLEQVRAGAKGTLQKSQREDPTVMVCSQSGWTANSFLDLMQGPRGTLELTYGQRYCSLLLWLKTLSPYTERPKRAARAAWAEPPYHVKPQLRRYANWEVQQNMVHYCTKNAWRLRNGRVGSFFDPVPQTMSLLDLLFGEEGGLNNGQLITKVIGRDNAVIFCSMLSNEIRMQAHRLNVEENDPIRAFITIRLFNSTELMQHWHKVALCAVLGRLWEVEGIAVTNLKTHREPQSPHDGIVKIPDMPEKSVLNMCGRDNDRNRQWANLLQCLPKTNTVVFDNLPLGPQGKSRHSLTTLERLLQTVEWKFYANAFQTNLINVVKHLSLQNCALEVVDLIYLLSALNAPTHIETLDLSDNLLDVGTEVRTVYPRYQYFFLPSTPREMQQNDLIKSLMTNMLPKLKDFHLKKTNLFEPLPSDKAHEPGDPSKLSVICPQEIFDRLEVLNLRHNYMFEHDALYLRQMINKRNEESGRSKLRIHLGALPAWLWTHQPDRWRLTREYFAEVVGEQVQVIFHRGNTGQEPMLGPWGTRVSRS